MSSVIMSQSARPYGPTDHRISLHHSNTMRQTNPSLSPSRVITRETHTQTTLVFVSSCTIHLLAGVYQLGQLTSAVNRRRNPAAINNKPQHPPTSTCYGLWSLGGTTESCPSVSMCTYSILCVCVYLCGMRVREAAYRSNSGSWHRLDITSDNKQQNRA